MTQTRRREKGRVSCKPFLKLTRELLDSKQYLSLSRKAKVLLVDIAHQYRGANNGDLTAAWGIMHGKRGWVSKDTLWGAIRELEKTKFIIRTRQGGKNLPNLFAVTWEAIDDCNGKHHEQPTKVASNLWKKSWPSDNTKLAR